MSVRQSIALLLLLLLLLPAGLSEAQPFRYCFTQYSKNGFFVPQGRHVAPMNVKFGTGKRTEVPLPHAKFHVHWGRNVGIQPQNCQNFEFWS